MPIYVVTNPEAGWDCVNGVYKAENEEQVKKFIKDMDGYKGDDDEWDSVHVIHETTMIDISKLKHL